MPRRRRFQFTTYQFNYAAFNTGYLRSAAADTGSHADAGD